MIPYGKIDLEKAIREKKRQGRNMERKRGPKSPFPPHPVSAQSLTQAIAHASTSSGFEFPQKIMATLYQTATTFFLL